MSETAPYVVTVSENVPNLATDTEDTLMLFRAPVGGTVTSVTYTTDANITGAATNHRAVALINRGQAGSGSTSVAALAFDSGVNATAGNETAVTLSGTAANLVVAEGDVLAWASTAPGSGLADPGGLVTVKIARS